MIDDGKLKLLNCNITLPGSKSYSHRALIIASLSNGPCCIKGILTCRDIELTTLALRKLGVFIQHFEDTTFVYGLGGRFESCDYPIFLENSGTSMRLLSCLATLGLKNYFFFGIERMHSRSIFNLMKALNDLKLSIVSLNNNGCSPIDVYASQCKTNLVKIDCTYSSQYLTSLLLISPYFKNGLKIYIKGKMISRFYIDITIDIMRKFGIFIKREGYDFFYIPGYQYYNLDEYLIEPDCSHACYFWAAAALTGRKITVKGLDFKSKQGDIKFLSILKRMGCIVYENFKSITVKGPKKLKSISVNMSDMPDVVPTLAVLSSFAEGITEIAGISHLKHKESDRIEAIVNELRRMKISVKTFKGKIIINGGEPKKTVIETYCDHRISMSFALAWLKIKDLKIKDLTSVNKSFPDYWKIFEKIILDRTFKY